MTVISCIVQEGQAAGNHVAALEEGLARIAHDFFGFSVSFEWTTVVAGSGFTAGKPSSASLVSMGVPDDIEQERRVELLSAICAMWSETTGCHINDVVAVARNENS